MARINRKHGRDKVTCAAYRNAGKREINKAVKLLRHLRFGLNDAQAKASLSALPSMAVKRAKHEIERRRGTAVEIAA